MAQNKYNYDFEELKEIVKYARKLEYEHLDDNIGMQELLLAIFIKELSNRK